jgi:Protein of unknown function (DUF3800)
VLAFVDESGDGGRKLDRGSSRYLVVGVVTFSSHDEANDCDDRISLLRSELRLPSSFEFHFSDNTNQQREAFLRAITRFDFRYHIFALNKDPKVLTGRGFDFKESLYKFAARMTFENAKPYLENATVVIDGSGERAFRNELAAYLRKRINDRDGPPAIGKVKIQRSDGNNLLQLADYVASISSRALGSKANGIRWRDQYLKRHRLTERTSPNG